QERLFFRLAQGHCNLCVVGDDDQALYRFRGATVENFVEFPSRCQKYLGMQPRRVLLSVNYRSRPPIVRFYGDYMDQCNWARDDGRGHHRVIDKRITPHRTDAGPAVVRTDCGRPDTCFEEIADLVSGLLDGGKVQDPNQIAFLYPSLKSVQVGRMKEALEARGLRVYAPRAGRFLQVEESTDLFGVLRLILGRSGMGRYVLDGGGDWNEYRTWLHNATARAEDLVAQDKTLALYVADRKAEITRVVADQAALLKVVERHRWERGQPYDIDTMKRPLAGARGLSEAARRTLTSQRFERAARRQEEIGRPYLLSYILRRATSLDWTVLDVFYRLCGMAHFRGMFDLAERGEDEGPICNLALISQYLRRFMDEYSTLITAELLADDMLPRLLFGSYLFALWRLGESEYEDREQPFPKGRIPFLTIHQAKGLEFPVVVLGNPAKRDRGPQTVEVMVRPFLQREEGEPLERVSEFDVMRMFYVALSRAQNLLVIAHLRGPGIALHPSIKDKLDDLPTITSLDVDSLPVAREQEEDLPRFYSYTGDYLAYRRCPRQYMFFRKYGFEASRTQTAFFGSLIHRTLDDLHNYLIAGKAGR
nr:ATP-dependent helicase [Chloroflexota bacterium]